MTSGEFWHQFLDANPGVNRNTSFQTWYFGNTPAMAAELAALVLSGQKTATASLDEVNKIEPENAPIDGGYSVVTDFEGKPCCIVQTTEIRRIPFNLVDVEFAFEEGEGDRSLGYWRGVHWDYFTAEALLHGITFDEHSLICCERFRLVYPHPASV